MDLVVWEDPPNKSWPSGQAADVAKQLRTRPKIWAKVLGPTSEQRVESLRVMLVQGGRSGIERGEFETRRKKIDRSDDLSYCLWARYVGNDAEAVG